VIPPEFVTRLARQGGVAAQVGPRGSVLLMHGNLVHASTENISPMRRALYAVVYSAVGNEPSRFEAPPNYLARDRSAIRALADDCLANP
jgi:ectoine hydroxylase